MLDRHHGGTSDASGRGDVVALKLRSAFAKRRRADEIGQCLRSGQEIVALAQRQVEILPDQRDEIEPGGQRHRAGGDAAIGAFHAHRLRHVGVGRARRLERVQRFEGDAGSRQQRQQQKLRAGTLRPQRYARAGGRGRGDVGKLQRIARRDQQALLAAGERDHHHVVQAGRVRDRLGVGAVVVAFDPVQVNARRYDVAVGQAAEASFATLRQGRKARSAFA